MEKPENRDLLEHARIELERAEDGDDATRLEMLERLNETLERELERDVDETPSSGR